ncbi:MAG: signal recognition particle receptor subunit alpha, partial [Burkholderiaceae bacterium]|nr:signal recognition particle receptor subunit alpha [Burkholderiaceae bacterium]
MFGFLRRKKEPAAPVAPPVVAPVVEPGQVPDATPVSPPSSLLPSRFRTDAPPAPPQAVAAPMDVEPAVAAPSPLSATARAPVVAAAPEQAPEPAPARGSWMARLKQGLSKTRNNLAGLFGGTRIDEALFEELETALLVSDAGVETTQFLLDGLRRRVKEQRLTDGSQVREALRALLTEMLAPLERPIDIDTATPLVM